MYLNFEFTMIVLTRNHGEFINDCLSSLDLSLDDKIEIFVIDIGSSDNTQELVSKFALSRKRSIQLLAITNPPFTSVNALQIATRKLTTDFFGIISGDDTVSRTYGSEVEHSTEQFGKDSVLNFVLSVTDKSLSHWRFSKPRWTKIDPYNSALLYFENPGKSPGAVIPVRVLLNSKFMNIDPRCLIEDYPLWLCLNELVAFRKIGNGEVSYRQHSNSLSKSRLSSEFAWSIGYCLGLAESSTQSIIKRMLLRLGKSRWMKQVDPSMRHVVLEGVATGLQFDWTIDE
jgi:glycosyltransferase involved in cell wall biosynthesis